MLSLIVAMTDERVIGVQNRLPWHLSEDLKRFKRLTMGHPIIMGRKTFESIGRALPGRTNMVVSGTVGFKPEGVVVCKSLESALETRDTSTGEEFVIGGTSLFKAALPNVSRLYVTLIHKKIAGDVTFPPIDLERDFVCLAKETGVGQGPEALPYTFLTLERR